MQTKSDYKFKVSLSNESYFNKEISGAMIGTTKDENNRLIRKKYGYKANKGIGYKEVEVNAGELLNKLVNGHVFCHLFNPDTLRKDGTFGSSQKKDDNFLGSYCIGVDIDETQYKTISDYINTLEYKPTFWYSSYSNKADKPKFRMVYVFSEYITGKYFFRYCAWQLNKKIEKDTKEVITDDCNLRCAQYFNGTNVNNPVLTVEFGITNNIYSISDFEITMSEYHNFLLNDCYYKSKSKSRKEEINTILSSINYYYQSVSTTFYNDLQKFEQSDSTGYEAINSESYTVSTDTEIKYNTTLVNDMSRLEYDEFMKYNRHKYEYFYRVEKDEWVDGLYQFVDEDFFSLYYNVNKVLDGSKRRKKVFQRMCLRRVIKPTVDIDTIIFNAYEDINRFFDNSDGILNTEYITKNALMAFDMSIDDIKEMFSENIAYLKSKKPKSGIILKKNVGDLAERNEYIKSIRYSLIDDVYDTNCTVSQNLEFINNNLFSICSKTLYNYCADRNIDTKLAKSNLDDEILGLYDCNLSIRKNLDSLKKMGYKISLGKLSNLIKNIQ